MADWKFAGIRSIGWGWTGVIWIYNIVTYMLLDPIKFVVRYGLSGKPWTQMFEQRIAFTGRRDLWARTTRGCLSYWAEISARSREPTWWTWKQLKGSHGWWFQKASWTCKVSNVFVVCLWPVFMINYLTVSCVYRMIELQTLKGKVESSSVASTSQNWRMSFKQLTQHLCLSSSTNALFVIIMNQYLTNNPSI